MLLPESVNDTKVWINGEVKDWKDCSIHIINHSLHYGSCVFEGERVYNGKIFKSREHSERLHRSANILNMQLPFSVEQIEAAKNKLLKDNGFDDAYIRCFAWRGGEVMGISANGAGINVAITMWQWPSYFPAELKEKGISLKTSKWFKPAPDTAPTQSKAAGLYMIGSLSKDQSMRDGYHDALMLDYRGYVAESTGANLFMVKDGKLFTAIADCFLNGITRRTVIQLAKDNGIEVTEKHILPAELMEADEIFLTGTAAEVTPVGKIDNTDFQVGDITRKLMTAYTELVNS